MADPRTTTVSRREANHSPLMKALSRRNANGIPNFCPFGCETKNLDDNGYCHHLIGFTNGGSTYEPRMPVGNGRAVVLGSKRQPLKKGMVLVKITTSARVYSQDGNPKLVIVRPKEEGEIDSLVQQEAELLRRAEEIRNPVLEGVWGGTIYDEPAKPPAKEKQT